MRRFNPKEQKAQWLLVPAIEKLEPEDINSLEVFFNRPGRHWALDELLSDLRAATEHICLVSAWFSDETIAAAFMESPAPSKCLILNRIDLARDGALPLVARLRDHIAHLPPVGLEPLWNEAEHDDGEEYYRAPHGYWVLGAEDWREGVMHHKFITIDHEKVWLGSYNYTYQARKNYENVVRIASPALASAFNLEARVLIDDLPLWDETLTSAFASDAFRCMICHRICSFEDLLVDTRTTPYLAYCEQCDGNMKRASAKP